MMATDCERGPQSANLLLGAKSKLSGVGDTRQSSPPNRREPEIDGLAGAASGVGGGDAAAV